MKQGSYKQKSTYKNLNSKALFEENNDEQVKLSSISKDVDREISNSEENAANKDAMKKLGRLRVRDVIKEITSEYERRRNYVRIFPARGADQYIKYFQHQKNIQKYIYKILFGDEIISHKNPSYEINFDGPKLSSY